MYEITGIIVFWILRIGLIALLVFFVYDFIRFRNSITRSVRTSETTWTRRPLTTKEATKELPWQAWLVFALALVLGFFSWFTLFIF